MQVFGTFVSENIQIQILRLFRSYFYSPLNPNLLQPLETPKLWHGFDTANQRRRMKFAAISLAIQMSGN